MKPSIIQHQKTKIVIFLAFSIFTVLSQAQDITGTWNGMLSIQGINLRIVFHINRTGDSYTSTMDSPDQRATGIPVTTTTFDGVKLSLAIPNAGISYDGEFKTDSIVGIFKQSGLSIPMTLKREPVEVQPVNKSQEPKPPYPYRSEDITFENKSAGITLAGTLTMPSTGGDFTAVILITGSGAQDRNEEIFGHKPFLVIADYLTRQGIAVLRFDDRGTAQSTGNFRTATTADFATDVESAIAWLKTRKEINPAKIGLMGHSEGGMIAPMVAARSKDVAFIVMLAGVGIRGDALLLLQNELLAKTSGVPEDKIAQTRNFNSKIYDKIVSSKEAVTQQEMTSFLTALKDELTALASDGAPVDDFIKNTAAQMASPWMQYFLRYDPAPTLEKVQCPVFAVNGSKDLQVPAKENLAAIAEAMIKGRNNKVIVKEYPGLNHLFQECTTGLPTEYATIEQTFSPAVLKDLADWIQLTIMNYPL